MAWLNSAFNFVRKTESRDDGRNASKACRLEGGDLPLEDALKAFEEGVRLTRQCQQSLDAAEQKVQLLLAKRDGSLDTEAFTPRDDS